MNTIWRGCGVGLAVVWLAALLGGCATIEIVQDPAAARIRVGVEDAERREALDVAPFVVGYALLSLAAYDDALYGLSEPKPASRPSAAPASATDDARSFRRLADPWVRPWVLIGKLINECGEVAGRRRDFGFAGERGSCAQDESPKGRVLDGLGLQIWTHGRPGGAFCKAVVLAFRGTDRRQTDDWLSNFRPVTRLLPLYDQYEQVQDHMMPILDGIERLPCYRKGVTEIIAVGHSLGGGLAQQAAYKDRRVRRVFAFDPSFITGYYDLPASETTVTSKGLRIERVYEHGEVLAYPRLLLRNIYPPQACDPQIRHIRFNLLPSGSIFAQHSLQNLTTKLLELAKGKAGKPFDETLLPVSTLAIGQTGQCKDGALIASAN